MCIRDSLEISIDVAEGEFKDFYATDYRGQNQEDKKWRGVLRLYVPKDDGSDMDEWTKSKLKAATNAVEDSNPVSYTHLDVYKRQAYRHKFPPAAYRPFGIGIDYSANHPLSCCNNTT